MDDLFAAERAERRQRAAPLPARLRPQRLADVVGHQQLLTEGAAFRTMVERGRPVSMILFGPPGTGKTTLARLVASESSAHFEALSATSASVKDVRAILASARHRIEMDEQRTVLFLDEIHRFNKAQQDALLPGVEDGTVILVGATTENPFFEVNGPLLSRCTLFRVYRLSAEDIGGLIRKALEHPEGLADLDMAIDDDALEALADKAGGDGRLALNALEAAAIVASGRGQAAITTDDIAEALGRRIVQYGEDHHYDVVSAFIKSMRGSDVDASLYWLHTMVEAGEDPEFIARRMIVLASEDIGLADSQALSVAVAAFQALQVVGLPEASFALSHAAVYLARAPKSNSVTKAMGRARKAVADFASAEVPEHLRDAHYSGAKTLGHGKGYKYPHDFPGHVVEQQYLPDGVDAGTMYEPSGQGDDTY